MQNWRRVVLGLVVGLLFPAVVVGIAALAPLANNQFITPVDGRILSVAWWLMVPLGTTAAMIVARRVWPGAVVGVASVFGFAWSLVLLLPVAERADALSSAAAWVSAAVTVALPWAIGMVFGSNSLQRRPMRRDGASRDATRTGRAVR